MKIFYRFLLVVAITATAFFVSGKRPFFWQVLKEQPAEPAGQHQTLSRKAARENPDKHPLLNWLPAAGTQTMGASPVIASKSVDKTTAQAGDTLTYSVTIRNNGVATEEGIAMTDQVDANTTAIADSLWYSPVALDDTFSCLGNVGITVPADKGVLTNDQTGSPVAVILPFTRTTSRGGSVTVNADGSFAYTPATGYSGTDTVQYLLRNRVGTDMGVITITIPNVIWFIDNNSTASSADGSLASPFKSAAAFQAVNNNTGNNPRAGHAIFVYESASPYNGSITLLNGQKLIGQDATTTIPAIAGFYLSPYSNTLPVFDNSNGVTTVLKTTPATTNAINLTAGGTNYLIRGLSIGDKTGKGIFGNNFGTLAVAETNVSGAGQALDLTNGTLTSPGSLTYNFGTLSSASGAYGVSLNNVSGTLAVSSASSAISGSTTTAFSVTGGSPVITYPGSIAGTRPVDIQNTSGANITLSGAISTTSLGINVTGNTGSTILFRGTSKSLTTTGVNSAVNLASNTGSTISFANGGLVINTTSGIGVNATGGAAAFSITGPGNSITVAGASAYTGGIALNVNNTTIGTGGLVFQSIASTNATKGIVLNNTGSTAGLAVTGTGATAGSGGTIQNTQSRGVEIISARNISLANMNLTNANQQNGGICTELDNSGCNAAVYISNTIGVSLSSLAVTGAKQEGLNFNSVTDLTLDNCTVVNAGDEMEEGALKIKDLQGTCAFTDSRFKDSKYRNGHIINNTGNCTLRITNCDFTFSTPTTAGDLRQDCFEMRTKNTATATVIISNSQFKRAGTKGIQLFAENMSTMTTSITGCTVDRVGGQMAGVEVGSSQSAKMFANIDGNPVINGTNEVAINVYAGGTSSAKTEATVRNNSNVSGYGDLNSYTDPTVQAFATQDAKGVALISGNTISNSDGQAILTRTTDGSGTMDATVESNSITIPANGFDGIEVRSGADITAFANRNCSYVLSNVVANNSTQGGHALFVQPVTPGTTVQLRQKAGTNGGSNVTTVDALWTANLNGGTNPNNGVYTEPGATLQMGTQFVCLTPTNLVAPSIILPRAGGMDTTLATAAVKKDLPETVTTPAAVPVPTQKAAATTRILSGESVTVSGITLPPAKMVIVQFKVRVNTPFPANVCSVNNQAQISGASFTAFATNTATTNINAAPVITACQSNIVASSGTCTSLQSFAVTATGCPAPTYTYTIEPSEQVISSPYAFPVGVTTVKAKASNVAGADSCTFTVTVTGTNATWVGGTSSDWHTASNWLCGAVPDIATNVTINNTAVNMPVLNADGAANNITLGAGASLTVNTGKTLQVNGDFSSSGSLTADGTMNFSGSTDQTIPAATYNNIIVSGGGNKTLAGEATVKGVFSFIDGTVTLGNHNLALGASSLVNGNSANSFFVTDGSGVLTRKGLGLGGNTGTVVFPVGPSAAVYTPVAFSNAGALDNFSVHVIENVYSGYNGTLPAGTLITTGVVNKTWFVSEEVSGGSNATLTLQWNSSDELPGFNRTMSYVSHNTGTSWLAGPVADAAGSDPYTRFLPNVTSFSPFGVGTAGSALPVQLLTLKGSQKASANLLEWAATNEQLQRYEVERSGTQNGFAKFGAVAAAGGSGVHQYNWTDNAPLQGNNFYRLRLIHPDGSATYSSVININRSNASPMVSVYPTPVAGGKLNLQLANLESGRYAVTLYSAGGQVVYKTSVAHDGGSSVQPVQLPGTISKGVYHLQVRKGEQVFYNQVVVQ